MTRKEYRSASVEEKMLTDFERHRVMHAQKQVLCSRYFDTAYGIYKIKTCLTEYRCYECDPYGCFWIIEFPKFSKQEGNGPDFVLAFTENTLNDLIYQASHDGNSWHSTLPACPHLEAFLLSLCQEEPLDLTAPSCRYPVLVGISAHHFPASKLLRIRLPAPQLREPASW